MLIETPRYSLRDLAENDRAGFVAYQTDPRYRELYDIADGDDARAHRLFELFVGWQREQPRLNFQLGIFERACGRLCGSTGLRMGAAGGREAELGVELTPDHWGRYRLAIDAVSALLDHGFECLDLLTIFGRTASGNQRVEKLAQWFGATLTGEREGAAWMSARGWKEIDWSLTRANWIAARGSKSRATPKASGSSKSFSGT